MSHLSSDHSEVVSIERQRLLNGTDCNSECCAVLVLKLLHWRTLPGQPNSQRLISSHLFLKTENLVVCNLYSCTSEEQPSCHHDFFGDESSVLGPLTSHQPDNPVPTSRSLSDDLCMHVRGLLNPPTTTNVFATDAFITSLYLAISGALSRKSMIQSRKRCQSRQTQLHHARHMNFRKSANKNSFTYFKMVS